jgi:glycosyltransferase involved in cell wall biosynthesis
MDDEGLRRELGRKGRKRIESELKWDIVKQNLLDAYARCLLSGPEAIAAEKAQEIPGR